MAASPPRPLFVPLEKPPQAVSLTVRKALLKVQAGEVRVPSFQRPLRWKASDVVKLFDSILKGYPIGSLLFWKRPLPADASYVLGNARLDLPAVEDGWLIVDGQQRLTALAASLLDLDHHGDSRWQVRFDPATSAFLSGAPQRDEQGTHVPLAAMGDLRRLGRWLRDCTLDEATQTHVELVQQRLLDYELPAYLMDTDDADGLKGAFARLNSTGVRMRPDEVFQALLGTEQRSHGPMDLDQLQEACDLDGFGVPPRPEVLKAVLAMSGVDPSRRLEDLGEPALQGLVGPAEATEALQRAVSFLRASPSDPEPGPGIPAYGLIPYPVAFVILSRWFHLYPETDALTRRELSRWLWRSVLTGVHQRAAVSAMRHQVKAIVPNALEASLDALLAGAGKPGAVDWSLSRFHATQAASRVEMLALLSRAPRDLAGPVSFRALLSEGQRVARDIIRSSEWDELSPQGRELAKTAANRALLDARHTGLSAELKRWRTPSALEALGSHLIDAEGFDALCQGQYDRFLQHRASLVRGVVSEFLTERAGLAQPRLRNLDAYFEPDEDESPRSAEPGL